MIDAVLGHVVAELNDYLYAVFPPLPPAPSDRNRIVLSTLFDLDGKVNSKVKDKVVASVVNVQEDRVYHSVDVFKRREDGTNEMIRPEIRVNIFLLFVANLADYAQAMKMISRVIAFFQHRPSFAYADIAALADRDGRFSFELASLTFEQQNHLWGSLGAKYMPSVVFKLGIVDIHDDQVRAEIPPVLDISANSSSPGA